MASACEVRLAGVEHRVAHALAADAIAEVRRIEAKYSRYRDDSVIARINASAGGAPVACDEETVGLLDYADALHAASGGLFDVGSGVLRRAWDFRAGTLPDAAVVRALLPLVGWSRREREGALLRLPQAGMEIDFGGFGKEYAADRAATRLVEAGARHGFVNLGGDIRVIGPQPDGAPWRFGIRDPRDGGRTVASLEVVRGGLATSGDYERYFEHAGRRYCHVLDPRTGWPVEYWRSVSVLAPLAVAAGSMTTIAMLMQGAGAAWLDAAGVAWLGVGPDGVLRRACT